MAKMELSAQEKKTLKSMFWNSGLVFCGFNMVKMEGNAFTCTMAPAIEELYSDPEERKQALVRHNNFFNTHAVLFSFIAGLAYALEREKVTKGSVDDDTIENIKVALMGHRRGHRHWLMRRRQSAGCADLRAALWRFAGRRALVSVENRLYDGHFVHRLDLLLRVNDITDQIGSHLGLKHGRRDGRFDGERQAGLDDSGRSDLGCRPRRRQLDYAGDLVGRTGLRPGRIN